MLLGLLFKLAAILVALLVAFVTQWVIQRKYKLQLFRKIAIPGPEQSLFGGNIDGLTKAQLQVIEQWIKKYGKVFGIFLGKEPYVMVTDPDVIRECFIRDNQNFRDRSPLPIVVEPWKSSLLCLKGDEWKHVRGVLNRSYTAAKVKSMMLTVDRCAQITVELMGKVAGTGVPADITVISRMCSMDIITKCALAWEVDCQRNPENPVLRKLEQFFADLQESAVVWAMNVPFLLPVIEHFFPYSPHGRLCAHIVGNLRELLRLRRKGPRPPVMDMLQLMLDEQQKASSAADREGEAAEQMPLTDQHLLANCFLSLAAGYESSATTLGFIFYELAQHPEEQERIYQEVTALLNDKCRQVNEGCCIPDSNVLDYNELQSLRRLDAVVQECLRLYPPIVSFVGRTCSRDTTLAGFKIPAGVHVMTHLWFLHHDPDFWPEPFRFDPDRFFAAPSTHIDSNKLSSSALPKRRAPPPCLICTFRVRAP
ncbi:hypothetical protein MTO96_049837 [Rhipicephalus appendiculatus]